MSKNLKQVLKYIVIITLIAITIVSFTIIINLPIGLKVYYDETQSCSLIFDKPCCGYKNMFGRIKINAKYDRCEGFIKGHAKVERELRYKGYTASEWDWLATHKEDMLYSPNGELITDEAKDKYNTDKTCINQSGDYISNTNCQ